MTLAEKEARRRIAEERRAMGYDIALNREELGEATYAALTRAGIISEKLLQEKGDDELFVILKDRREVKRVRELLNGN